MWQQGRLGLTNTRATSPIICRAASTVSLLGFHGSPECATKASMAPLSSTKWKLPEAMPTIFVKSISSQDILGCRTRIFANTILLQSKQKYLANENTAEVEQGKMHAYSLPKINVSDIMKSSTVEIC